MTAEILPQLLTLCCFAFLAGFVDAIVGGGGLIQTPALLFTLPSTPLMDIFGTAKLASLVGTSTSVWQYARKVRMRAPLLLATASTAFAGAMSGSLTVAQVSSTAWIKPLMLVLMAVIAVYTFIKKDFGSMTRTISASPRRLTYYGAAFGGIIGFYDGFFGPGTGSFLVLSFIAICGMDFLQASAHGKAVNCATNLGSLTFFAGGGHVLLHFALPMAACNALGSWLGARTAIAKGNGFVRMFFLLVVCATIARFGWDIVRA